MMPRSTLRSALLIAALFAAPLLSNAQTSPDEVNAKLREALRDTMLKLRSAEGERDVLKATQSQLEQEKNNLQSQVDTLAKRAAEDQDAAKKAISGLEADLAEKEALVSELQGTLVKWKGAYEELTAIAKKKESERAELAAEKILNDRRIADLETKNRDLFTVGNEILTRYENYGLGIALTAREPFVGLTRVKLQNLVQDYRDKLDDGRDRPVTASAAGTTPAPAEVSD